MDLSLYPDDQKSFMARLYNALLAYTPKTYVGDTLVYEARVRPLFWLPQVGRVWREIAPRAEVVGVRGTHLSILREDDVGALAEDLQMRIARMFPQPGSTSPSPASLLAPRHTVVWPGWQRGRLLARKIISKPAQAAMPIARYLDRRPSLRVS